jgi:tetratricopeptide (TPR) repeat protein
MSEPRAPETDDTGIRQKDAIEEGSDPLKPKIAVTLAIVVVIAGMLAVLQTQAGANESTTARETTRTAVRAMSANVATSTLLGVRSEVQAEHDFLPYRRPLDPGAPSLTAVAGLTQQANSVSKDLQAAQRLPTKQLLSELGPLQLDAERQVLKQQALATTRVTWNTRSTQYTTVLAVLAAALFLVGFGLVVEGSVRRLTYGLGLAIAAFVVVWGAWIYHLPIPSTPNDAITAAAQGAVLTSDGDYRGAVAAYDRAIAAHEDFATAYSGRARARLLAANPDYPLTRAFTEPRGSATAAAVADANRALELGGHRDLLGEGLLELVAFYRGDYPEAVRDTDAAIEINPGVPDVWLLKSAAQLALGQDAAADASLTKALRLLDGSDPSQRTRLLAASYLSYLAAVAHNSPARAPQARRLSTRVVATETAFTLGRKLPGALPATGRVQADDLRFTNGRLSLVIRWQGLPAGTALGAIAYERPRTTGAWAQPPDLALFATIGSNGKRRISVPLSRVCEPTAVRADVYLDGAPALSTVGPGVSSTC